MTVSSCIFSTRSQINMWTAPDRQLDCTIRVQSIDPERHVLHETNTQTFAIECSSRWGEVNFDVNSDLLDNFLFFKPNCEFVWWFRVICMFLELWSTFGVNCERQFKWTALHLLLCFSFYAKLPAIVFFLVVNHGPPLFVGGGEEEEGGWVVFLVRG